MRMPLSGDAGMAKSFLISSFAGFILLEKYLKIID
jgi:hypothetical protein